MRRLGSMAAVLLLALFLLHPSPEAPAQETGASRGQAAGSGGEQEQGSDSEPTRPY